MSPYPFSGRVALITGAGGGIGRAQAIDLARRGARLALADVNPAGLTETAALLPPGVEVSTHVLDVTDAAAVAALPAAIEARHGGLDLLINNAGVALGGTFDEVDPDDFDWLMQVNFFGLVRMTRAFLPLLKRSDEGRIVNLSSVFGIVAPAGQTAYCASKFAVRGFSNALGLELAGTSVGVTVVHPGGVATNIARAARAPRGADAEEVARRTRAIETRLVMDPARAAELILKGVEQRKARVLVGTDAKIATLLERLAPVGHRRLLAARTRK